METIKRIKIKRSIIKSRGKKFLDLEDYKNRNLLQVQRKSVQTNIKGEKMGMENADWDKFQSSEQYVKLEAGRPKTIEITDFEMGTSMIRTKKEFDGKLEEVQENIPAIICKVGKEDGEKLKEEKIFKITSKRLASVMRPLLEKKTPITVKVTQFGTGFSTTYEVSEA